MNKYFIIIIIIPLTVLGLFVFGQDLWFTSSANILEIESNYLLPPQKPKWTLLEKIEQARTMLEGMDLFVGEDEITYHEDRVEADSSGKIRTTDVKLSEEAKEIALAILNTKTGNIKIVVIKKEGDKLIGPSNMNIELVTRSSGIRWNYWNTEYKIKDPEGLIVIGNRYPMIETMKFTQRVRNKSGKMVSQAISKRLVKYVYYVPYSEGLHKPEIIEAGRTHIKDVVTKAFTLLGERNVMSKAIPDTKIARLGSLKHDFFEHLPLLEHSDLGEFVFDPKKTAERVLVIVGSNGNSAYKQTCNSSGACGLVQFISSSYSAMRNNNPKAELIKDSIEGRADHVNTMMAAILHHDAVLNQLVKVFGKKILTDQRLEEYLAAGYNGSYAHVISSLRSTLGKKSTDWTKSLKRETLGFIVKLRYIRENDLI